MAGLKKPPACVLTQGRIDLGEESQVPRSLTGRLRCWDAGTKTYLDRRSRLRIRIGIPPGALGSRPDQMNEWRNQNCGADGRPITSSGFASSETARSATFVASSTMP